MSRVVIAVSMCALLVILAACAKSPEQEFVDYARQGDIVAIESSLDAGMNLDARGRGGRTALMAAAFGTHYDVVKFLADKGADLNLRDDQGRTALMIAVQRDQYDIAKLLLQKGTDPNIKDNEGNTALSYARGETAQMLEMAGAEW